MMDRCIAEQLGRSVELDERVYQALEVLTRRGTAPTSSHVWACLARSLPAIWRIYAALDYDPSTRPNPQPRVPRILRVDEEDWVDLNWTRTWRDILTVKRGDGGADKLTLAASNALSNNRLTVVDLASSILQSGSMVRRRLNNEVRLTNLVVRHLAKATHHGIHRRWSREIEIFTQSVVSLLQPLERLDESAGRQQFLLVHDGSRIRIRPFGAFGGYALSDVPLRDGKPLVARGNVIQRTPHFHPESLSQLEELINSDVKEQAFQEFFEQHPEFLLALGHYSALHSQLVLTHDDGSLVPDFFLERLDSNFADVCDLKRSNVELVRNQMNRVRFRAAVTEAVSQVTYYRDYFDDPRNRAAFSAAYGLEAFRPRVVVIIGRRRSYADEVQRITLEPSLPSWVDLRTYDDVLARASQWRRFVDS
jgi:hypothetical protein